jgi:ABC-type multidrug transport system fused ATPase/permease subunit
VDAEPQVQDQPDALSAPEEFHLQVNELGFRYPDGKWALRGLSFDLPAGKRLAIVGPSGAGKTTLLNLLLRFWDYHEGQMLWGGREQQYFLQEEIRSRISVVPQRVYLFSASVRDNLRIANPKADQQQLEQAANLAQIHDFILSLPAGYDTWVGEQGVQLSGGERQRLAIARALLKDAPLLALDEWSANLDALAERKISESILTARPVQALLVITHRLVGMEAMDEILVLDKGRVVERGRHAELLAAGGIYSRMYEIQQQLLWGDTFL